MKGNPMTIYHGTIDAKGERHVTVDGKPLPPRLDLFDHSPAGFAWGYSGSGPAQLALAILAHHLADSDHRSKGDRMAVTLHQLFKEQVLAPMHQEKEFMLTDSQVRSVLARLLSERPAGP
jgi:hypothetical protein